MGLYDQFLGLTQQGLDQGTQLAVQKSQMPTMADVFMDRFRQGGQDQMAHQKLAQDEAYKNATLANTDAQRKTQAMQVALGLGNQKNISAIIPYLKQAGIDTSGFNPETFAGAQQYKADKSLEGTHETNDTKWNIALLKADTDQWMASLKGMKPQDAIGKLNWDYANQAKLGISISPEQYSDRYAKINTIINPIAAGAATQGIQVAPTLAARRVAPPVPGVQQPMAVAPGMDQMQPLAAPVQPQALPIAQPQARQRVLPPAPMPSVGVQQPGAPRTVANAGTPLLPNGSDKLATVINAKDSAIQGLDKLHRDVEDVMQMPGFSKIAGMTGAIYRNPASPEGYSAYTILQKIKNAGTLGELINLKNSGGTLGQVSNQEGERLERAFAAIDLNQPEPQLRIQLQRIMDDINVSRARINAAAQTKAQGLGSHAGEFHAIGEVQPDNNGNVWKYRGGQYSDRKNWQLVGGGK